jgi:hypothetical protein
VPFYGIPNNPVATTIAQGAAGNVPYLWVCYHHGETLVGSGRVHPMNFKTCARRFTKRRRNLADRCGGVRYRYILWMGLEHHGLSPIRYVKGMITKAQHLSLPLYVLAEQRNLCCTHCCTLDNPARPCFTVELQPSRSVAWLNSSQPSMAK